MRELSTAHPGGSSPLNSAQEADAVKVGTVNKPGFSKRVDGGKYAAMRKALLKVLPVCAPGLTQAEMFGAVLPQLPDSLFPGGAKASWWAKTIQLDLEAKGIVVRERCKPLRWQTIR